MTRGQKDDYVMTKGKMQQEDVTIPNMRLPREGSLNGPTEGEADKLPIPVGGFTSQANKSSEQLHCYSSQM